MIKQSLTLFVLTIAAALTLTACGGAGGRTSSPADGGGAGTPAVHMDNTTFLTPSTTIQSGQSLTLIADTFAPHFIANGTWAQGDAKPAREPGAPEVSNLDIPGNGSGTIGPFTTPGTFQLYCTIHPKMNLAVVVK
jgi:plastocyanin